MAVTSFYDNREELNAILMDNFSDILASVLNGDYAYYEDAVDGYDRIIVIFVDPLVFVLARNSSWSGDESPAVITELPDEEDSSTVPCDDATPEDNNFAEPFLSAVDDALAEADALSGGIEATEEVQLGEVAESNEKRATPRRNRFSAGWKRVKRVFRRLCCCGRGRDRP